MAYVWLSANIPRRDSLEYPMLRGPGGYINQPDIEGAATFCTAGYLFPGRFSHTILFGWERFR